MPMSLTVGEIIGTYRVSKLNNNAVAKNVTVRFTAPVGGGPNDVDFDARVDNTFFGLLTLSGKVLKGSLSWTRLLANKANEPLEKFMETFASGVEVVKEGPYLCLRSGRDVLLLVAA